MVTDTICIATYRPDISQHQDITGNLATKVNSM